MIGKLYHVANDGGLVTLRSKWTPFQVSDPTLTFQEHEESQFLNRYLPEGYAEFAGHAFGEQQMIDVCNWMESYALRGASRDGVRYRFLYGQWTDKGKMVMVPSTSSVRSLSHIGLSIHDPKKAPKRLKRLFAHHKLAAFGTVHDVSTDTEGGTIVTGHLDNGYEYTIRFVDISGWDKKLQAIVAGQNRITPTFLRALGVENVGDGTFGFKGTIATHFFGKGYFWEDLNLNEGPFDAVIYDYKTEVSFDKFFFGILSPMNPGEVTRSDSQSAINFGWEHMLEERGQFLMLEMAEAYKDEAKLRRKFLSTYSPSTKPDAEEWCLIKGLRIGISPQAEPAMFRRVVRQITQSTMDFKRGRMDIGHVGKRVSFCPDPDMFDHLGNVHPERSRIPAGTVVCPDVPNGDVCVYRSPNGHALEHSRPRNINDRRFRKFKRLLRLFYGADAYDFMLPQNGADADDDGTVIFDPKLVKIFHNLQYPVTDKLEMKQSAAKANAYLQRMIGRAVGGYTAQDFIEAMNEAKAFNLKIGQIVNLIMLDTLLSGDNKKHMLQYLYALENKDALTTEAILWLEEREDYQLREVASNLEAVIDFCQMGKGDRAVMEELVSKVQAMMPVKDRGQSIATIKVYPKMWTLKGTGFQGEGRTPRSLTEGIDFVTAPSLMCDALASLQSELQLLNEAFRQYEWKTITPVPPAVNDLFPADPDTRHIVEDIRQEWNARMIEQIKMMDDVREREYKKSLAWIKAQFAEFDPDTQKAMAVEMKRRCHRFRTPVKNEDGTTRHVPDSAFGNTVVFNLYCDAVQEAGIAGLYVPVEMDEVSSYLKTQTVDIRSRQGVIFRKDDNFMIGLCPVCPDGDHTMDGGEIMVQEPDFSLSAAASYGDQSDELEYAVDVEETVVDDGSGLPMEWQEA
jgi:hypothetical protein